MRVFAGLVPLTLAALVCGLFAPVAARAAPTWTQGTAPGLQAVPLIQAGDVTWTLSHNAFDPTGAVAIGRRAGTGAFVSDPGPGSANIQLGQWAMNAQGQGVITATSFDVGGTVVARREQGTWSNFTQLAGDEHPVSAAVDDAGNSTVVTMRNNSDVSQNVYAYTRDGTRSLVYAGAPDRSLSAELDRSGRAILIIDRAGGDSVGPMVKVATVDGVGGWAVQTVATVLNTAMAHNIIDGHGIAVGADGTIAATWSELHADFDVGSEYLTAIRVAVKAPGQDWDAQTVESATSVYEASGQSGPGVSRGRIGVAAATPIVAYSRYQVVGSNPQSGQVAVSEYRNGMWIAAPGVTASHGGTYCGGGDAVVAANDAGQAVVAGTRREGNCGVEESTYVVANTRGADGQWAVASLDRAQATAVWHADLDQDGHAVVEQQPGGAGPVDIYDAYLGGRTQITGGPSGLVAVGNPTFSWANTPEGASSRCRMDDGPWLACSSPQSYPGLGDGPHVFSVHSVVDDRSGVADTRAFALDTTAPQTTITSAPPASSENAFAEVRFTADDPNVTFVCALDGGAALPCTSPYQTLALAPGAHTLSVAATD
ncbi:MAG: putative internalin, partial [Solirubrobacterales bacterium]|nr:putative internalin [Solirubrobacterales bacterium]